MTGWSEEKSKTYLNLSLAGNYYMNVEEVQSRGARTEIALDNAYEEIEQAVTDVPVPDDEFTEIRDTYQEAKSEYGEAVEHAYEAAKVAAQDDFGENKEEVDKAVRHMIHSREVAEDARETAHELVETAHENSANLNRRNETKDDGFPEITPEDRINESRGYLEDASENYGELASTVELSIEEQTDTVWTRHNK